MKKTVILLFLFMFIFVERAYAGAQKPAVPAIQSPSNNAVLKIQNVTITWKDPYLQKTHYLWLIEESENKVILKK